MSKNVFANGREVSAKKDANASLAAMPDVCLSPPSPPAGPVPIPYPNTSKAEKTDEGSKTVQIGGDEVGKKNSSNYKESNGDEAATKSLGMGVVSHTIQGKMKHAAWSMDVKVEGKNVIRHMDMTTHNHINQPNIATQINNAGQFSAQPGDTDCEALEKIKEDSAKNDTDSGKINKGETLTTGKYTDPAGNSVTMKGASHIDSIKSSAQSSFSTGSKWPMSERGYMQQIRSSRAGVKTYRYQTKMMNKKAEKFGPDEGYRACNKDNKYTNPAHSQHAEATMIEDIIKKAEQMEVPNTGPGSLGSLTLNIHWKPGSGGDRDDPCTDSCRDLVCEAIECGLEIKICQDGKEKNAADDCKNGKSTNNSVSLRKP